MCLEKQREGDWLVESVELLSCLLAPPLQLLEVFLYKDHHPGGGLVYVLVPATGGLLLTYWSLICFYLLECYPMEAYWT